MEKIDLDKIKIGFTLITFIFLLLFSSYKNTMKDSNNSVKDFELAESNLEITEKLDECVRKEFSDEDLTQDLNEKIEEINTYIDKNYNASVVYEDVSTGFKYAYNEDTIYYGASLIKLVEVMYIFDEAERGNIDINETITYTSNYKKTYSVGMEKHKIGDEVSLKELISYAIMYSDNSAHFMLIDYIGKENLKKYGKSLGAKYTLYGTDTFGSQTAFDTNIYLEHAYEIIENNDEYGPLLKEYMMNTYYNSLYLTDEENNNVAHKYGWYSYYYHDIGIVYESRPYLISILTLHGRDNYEDVVKDIHEKVNELHNFFYENRKDACMIEIYGE